MGSKQSLIVALVILLHSPCCPSGCTVGEPVGEVTPVVPSGCTVGEPVGEVTLWSPLGEQWVNLLVREPLRSFWRSTVGEPVGEVTSIAPWGVHAVGEPVGEVTLVVPLGSSG